MTDLLDVPQILQVMVFVNPAEQDYLTEPLSSYQITYESVFPKGGNIIATSDYDVCFLFEADPADPTVQGQPSTLCALPDQNGDCVCPASLDGPLSCATSGDLIGRCVDPATMKLPTAAHAAAAGASIRVVVGKLLDGATLEHFACACQGTQITALNPAACGSEAAWSDDPNDCSVCGGTGEAAGRCVDTDSNGLPDVSSLIPGVAVLTCTGVVACPTDIPGWTGTAASCVYTTQEGDGFFYPSGNQFQSSVAGLGGIGPAIVINPAAALPTAADCTITIADFVKFKTGEGITAPATVPTFHTEDLGLSLASPGDTINITNSTALSVTVSASAPISAATITVSVEDLNSSTTVTATNSTPDISGTDAESTFPTTTISLINGHDYTITVTGSATDAFGQAITISVDDDTEITVNSTAAVTVASKR